MSRRVKICVLCGINRPGTATYRFPALLARLDILTADAAKNPYAHPTCLAEKQRQRQDRCKALGLSDDSQQPWSTWLR